MADRWAVAAGNWSNTATWNGGTLPGTGDDVFADGRAVTIDQNITVLSIRTTQRSGGTAGGSFTVSGTRTINANVTAGTTACLTISTSSSNITLNGNVTGGSAANAGGLVFSAASSTLNLTGSVTGGTNANARGVLSSATNTSSYTITGNLSSGSSGAALRHSGQCVGTVNGNLASTLSVSTCQVVATGTVNINGNLSGDNCLFAQLGTVIISSTADITGAGTSGVLAVAGGNVFFSGGNLLAGAASAQWALAISTSGTVQITGNVTASTASTCVTVSGGTIYVLGNVTASGSFHGISLQGNDSIAIVIGNVSGASGTGDGISSTSSAGCIVVHGIVTGGAVAGGHGISNSGRRDIRIFGSEVAGAGAAAVSNTGSGTKTTVAVGGGGSSLPLIGPGGLVY